MGRRRKDTFLVIQRRALVEISMASSMRVPLQSPVSWSHTEQSLGMWAQALVKGTSQSCAWLHLGISDRLWEGKAFSAGDLNVKIWGICWCVVGLGKRGVIIWSRRRFGQQNLWWFSLSFTTAIFPLLCVGRGGRTDFFQSPSLVPGVLYKYLLWYLEVGRWC